MTNTKMTKKEMFAEIIAIATDLDREDIIEFAEHEVELLNKKSSAKKKTSDADVSAMEAIESVLEGVEPMTCTEIIKATGLDVTTPKMSALLKKLITEGRIHREVKGKKAVFSLV